MKNAARKLHSMIIHEEGREREEERERKRERREGRRQIQAKLPQNSECRGKIFPVGKILHEITRNDANIG